MGKSCRRPDIQRKRKASSSHNWPPKTWVGLKVQGRNWEEKSDDPWSHRGNGAWQQRYWWKRLAAPASSRGEKQERLSGCRPLYRFPKEASWSPSSASLSTQMFALGSHIPFALVALCLLFRGRVVKSAPSYHEPKSLLSASLFLFPCLSPCIFPFFLSVPGVILSRRLDRLSSRQPGMLHQKCLKEPPNSVRRRKQKGRPSLSLSFSFTHPLLSVVSASGKRKKMLLPPPPQGCRRRNQAEG